MPIEIKGETLLAEAEAAQRLHLSYRTLKRWRDLHSGPPFLKIGRSVFYREYAMRDWVLKREATGAAA